VNSTINPTHSFFQTIRIADISEEEKNPGVITEPLLSLVPLEFISRKHDEIPGLLIV